METRNYKVYQWDEASKELQSKILEKHRDINVEYWEWWHAVEDNFKDDMSKKGYTVEKMYFSGFSSQGDGACFEGTIELKDFMKAYKLGNKYKALYNASENIDYSLRLRHEGHYYHAYCMKLDAELYSPFDASPKTAEKIEAQWTELEDYILSAAREEARKLYIELESEYDFITSDDAVIDTLRSNEYYFTEEGDID